MYKVRVYMKSLLFGSTRQLWWPEEEGAKSRVSWEVEAGGNDSEHNANVVLLAFWYVLISHKTQQLLPTLATTEWLPLKDR